MEAYFAQTRIILMKGDLTLQDTEAIVNAANPGLLGGGGVDGAIHRAGGPKIMQECEEIRAIQGGCPTGQAVITSGGSLRARYVIHTVGPVWHGGSSGEDQLLRQAYQNSLALARLQRIQSLSFPSISTGAYGFPVERAAPVALSAMLDYLQDTFFREIRFVLFSDRDLQTYKEAGKDLMANLRAVT